MKCTQIQVVWPRSDNKKRLEIINKDQNYNHEIAKSLGKPRLLLDQVLRTFGDKGTPDEIRIGDFLIRRRKPQGEDSVRS